RIAPILSAVGARIKQCRHAADKSQEALAFEARVDRTYISSIERGIANPSVETLATYAAGHRQPAEVPLDVIELGRDCCAWPASILMGRRISCD
ncbi:helix-turn-helix domain-containing protein, partial [Ralstonia solanacearum]